jgi:acyl-CoA synthetase (AMP-forming)/AMP-acid ligase II
MGPLERHAHAQPDAPCLADAARALTWGEWDARSAALAAGLADTAGIAAGDRVVLALGNVVEWFELSFALAKLGASEVAAPPGLDAGALAALAADAGAVAVATAAGLATGGGAAVPLASLAVPGAAPQPGGHAPPGVSLAYAAAPAPPGWERHERTLGPERAAAAAGVVGDLLQRTGARARTHLVAAPLAEGPPAMHAQLALALGGSVTLLGAFEPSAALALIEEHAIAHTYLTPAMVAALTALPAAEQERWDTSSLDVVLVGGPLDPDTTEAAIDLFGEDAVHTVAGDARTGPIAVLRPEEQLERAGAAGRPLAAVTLTPAGDGTLTLDSPLAADGARELRGRLDEEGYLWLAT